MKWFAKKKMKETPNEFDSGRDPTYETMNGIMWMFYIAAIFIMLALGGAFGPLYK